MTAAVDALLADHPQVFDAASAEAWVSARRALLAGRATPADVSSSVSSGCAASGARTHAQVLAQDAEHALSRLEAGLLTRCEVCGAVLPVARLDGAPAAVRCVGCARPDSFDARWCR